MSWVTLVRVCIKFTLSINDKDYTAQLPVTKKSVWTIKGGQMNMLNFCCAGTSENYRPISKDMDVPEFFMHKIVHSKFQYVFVYINVCTERGIFICAYQVYIF